MKRIILATLLISGCKGKTGDVGPMGTPGAPGYSCTTEPVSNGAIIRCEDGTSTVILNGTNGQDGEDANPSAYSIAEVIRPCPGGTGFREVLFRLYNGDLIAHYSHGNQQFLTFITPGNYVLTDGSRCRFTVNQDLTVTWGHDEED